jgi:tetratricopeptide (TPR) repeat protein
MLKAILRTVILVSFSFALPIKADELPKRPEEPMSTGEELIKRGDVLLDTKPSEALKLYDSAIAIDDTNALAYIGRVRSRFALGRATSDWLPDCKRALQLDGNLSFAHNCIGVALSDADPTRAIAEYDKAIQLQNPVSGGIFINKAEALITLKRFDEAIAASTKAIELNPRNDRFWETRARAEYSKLDCDHALVDMRDARSHSRL